MSRTIECEGKFFIWYFVDPPLTLITSKIRLGLLSTSFWSWTVGIFPMCLRLRFWVQKLLSTVDLLHKLLRQSIPKNILYDWGLESTLGGQEDLFFVQASISLLLIHCGWQHYLAEKSILLDIVRDINHLASSHNLLLFVDHWQIVV